MKVNQIATMLNEVFAEVIGESELIAEDLSNIVSVGNEITSSTEWGNNFDNYVKAIIDKVGKTIFVDRTYKSTAPPILKDAWEYGSILEKVRVNVGDYEENKAWQLTRDQTFDIFGFFPIDVDVKYFNNKVTFMEKFSIARKQMKSAFTSAQSMNHFVSTIENRIKMKMTIATDNLIMRTIVNLIAEKFKSNNNVVNLLAMYKATTGATINAAQALTDQDFLAYASRVMMTYKTLISGASMLYNDDGYVTFTPEDRLKIVLLTDFASALKTRLYANTYNEEFVMLPGYTEVPYWQGVGTSSGYADRSAINCIPASENGAEEPTTINKTGIVGVMFDEWAAMVCNEEPEVEAMPNPEGKFINYWYTFDASYFNDLGENVVVFTIQD